MTSYAVEVEIKIKFDVEADSQEQAEDNAVEMWRDRLEDVDIMYIDVWDPKETTNDILHN